MSHVARSKTVSTAYREGLVRKRWRKKLHVGEFQELGFEVHFQIADNFSQDAFDAVVDAFISQAMAAHGLVCGGGGTHPEWNVFVTREGRGSATEEHRQAIETWLAARPEVRATQIGPLVDAWYPPSYSRKRPFWIRPCLLI
jgi:hypothetical protein